MDSHCPAAFLYSVCLYGSCLCQDRIRGWGILDKAVHEIFLEQNDAMKRCRTRIFQAVATVVAKVLKWVQAKGIMPQEQQEVKPG